MAENKTQPTRASAKAFVESIADEAKRADAKRLLKIFADATGEKPVMWGPSIIGYGSYHYKYDSGREGEMCLVGFSPRAAAHALYVNVAFPGHDAALKKLGKCKTAKVCLYIKKLADVDAARLQDFVAKAYEEMRRRHG